MPKLDSMRIWLWSLLFATAASIWATAPLADGPAWVQAILSGSAILTTGLFWQIDKQRERKKHARDLSELRFIVSGSVQNLRAAAEKVVEVHKQGVALDPIVLALRQVDYRFKHLKLFSPYDRLEEFALVDVLASVEVCCNSLLETLQGPLPEMGCMTNQFEHAVLENFARVIPRAKELIDRCNVANAALIAFAESN